MSAITPTGPYMKPLAKLADTLATFTSLQTRFGIDTNAADAATQCRARIYLPVIDNDRIRDLLPCAVVTPGDNYALRQVAGGSINFIRPSGSLRLILAGESRHDDLLNDETEMGNWVGAVLTDLIAIAGASSNLNIHAIRQELPIVLPSAEEENSGGRYFLWSCFIDWD